MRTLDSYAYEILETLQKNLTDDFEVDIRLIKEIIIDQRKIAISNSINKGDGSGYGGSSGYDGGFDHFLQELTVSLEEITYVAGGGTYSNRRAWQSTTDIPRIMISGRRPAVYSVYLNWPDAYDYKQPTIFSTRDRALYCGSGRFNSPQIVSYLNGKRLTIVNKFDYNDRTITQAKISAIFEDPRDVSGFADSTSEFPMGKQWSYIKPFILKDLQFKLGIGEDKINDATNN